MPELTSVSEIGRKTCVGCGNEVVIVQAPIIGGPDKGRVITQHRGCVCWENEQAREAKRNHKTMMISKTVEKYSTMNPDLEQAAFDNFDASTPILQAALKLAMDYVRDFDLKKPKNLLFAGLYGLGKSHLAWSICRGVAAKGFTGVFISVPKLLTVIKSTYNRDSQFTEAEILDVLAKVDLLVLDDVGAEKSRKEDNGETWASEKLFEVIDGRSGRHTIYTTNLTSDELAPKVGQRNFSRMMMHTQPVKFEGDDYRIKHKRF